MKEIVIIDALRTPVGRYDGALAEYSAAELGTHVVSNLLSKHENIKSDVEQVIFGNVLQAGNGQNIARQIAIHSGLSNTVPASTINEVCGSGMKAVILAKQLLQLGEAEVVIAGGTESMSNAPIRVEFYSCCNTRNEPGACHRDCRCPGRCAADDGWIYQIQRDQVWRSGHSWRSDSLLYDYHDNTK